VRPRMRQGAMAAVLAAAVVALALPLMMPPAAAASAAQTRVGAPRPEMIITVGVSRSVSAGERRCGAAPQG
jgi:hypothetical protein